uniref:Bestrophin homolog n=1 Tax=Globodera pallida TaxID=36090 RepID=A0A183CBP5_GLOPA
MTISYSLDVSKSSWGGFFRILSRWRGSVWKAVLMQLSIWTTIYMLISLCYRRLLNTRSQETFEHLVHYLNTGLDSTIPLTFMLGFFVTQVVSRWQSILNALGWIDNSAMNFANYIRGSDTETRITRRTLVRYMVLCQALVLRDISLQVRKRFPTLDTLVAAGLISKPELEQLEKEVHDPYSRYWTPIHWCYALLYEARLHGKIASDFLLDSIINDIQHFRHGLATLMKYDWVPIPLLYPQIVFLAVRLYFLICLISRQFIFRKEAKHHHEIDLFVPIGTMIQFIVYVGWMKVAEALLNPMGEDDDDLECNYVIDKNLITGLSLVDLATKRTPEQSRDVFWDNDHIAPLYSMESAKRTVHPLIGSASKINMAKSKKTITMTPHKSKLSKMDERTRLAVKRFAAKMEYVRQCRQTPPGEFLTKIGNLC